jgi:TolB-like protein/DNA-binding winged helix-turn-helix (wHTH) protein/tetratricopeptide (TPR) repeat protein
MTDEPTIDPQTAFQVGDWRIEPDTGRMRCGETEVKLEPKVMTVLLSLANQAGKVVTREQLEATAWAGVIVGYDSLASTIIKLRKAFEDDSKNPRFIETVPKKGYRLIAPVKALRPEPVHSEAADPVPPGTVKSTRVRPLLLAAVILVFVMVSAVLLFPESEPGDSDSGDTAAVDTPTVAVLPFKNISNDTEQDYFSDGITGDLITDLSKLSGLSVIARNSVFSYKGTDVDVRKVGKELGARYIIEGSVRKAGNQVRISARLIDTRNGFNLWADRFDSPLDDIFAMQDEVTAKIVASLKVKLTDSERVYLARNYTNSIEAYDNFLRGWQHLWKFSKDGNQQAREYYLRAIELDKTFARAYANLAITHAYDYLNGWSETAEQSLELANEFARKAIEIDDRLPQVHWAMGLTYIFSRNYNKALEHAEKALELDPNFADGYGILATALNYAARPKEALQVMQKAMRLNPRHPFVYKVICGEIYFNLHDYPNAIDYFEQALERNPEAQEARLWLAAAYGHLGKSEEATWQLDHVHNAGAELSLDYIEKVVPFKDPSMRKHLIDGLYNAGLKF